MPKTKVSANINQRRTTSTTGVTVVSGGAGGGSQPGTLTGTTTNTVTSTGLHYHAVQLPHASLLGIAADDHHDPVTVGNTGLSLSTQELSLALAGTSGLQISSGLMLADTVAGDGLAIASKVLSVGVSGLGLGVTADAVTLTSSSNPGATASILASDASGYLALTKLTTPLLDTASGNMELTPAGDLILDPVGNDILPETGYDLNLGAINKKYLTLHAAELWVETLVAQNTIATIGGRILVGPTTKLTNDLASGDGVVNVEHNEWNYNDTVYMEANGQVEFMLVSLWLITDVDTANDWFKVSGNWSGTFAVGQYFTVAGSTGNNGEWVVEAAEYIAGESKTKITVTGNITNATTDGHILYRGRQGVGPFRYRVTRDRDGSGANAWYAGDAVFNTGQAGDGFIDLYSVSGVKSGYGPTIVGNVRTSTTYNAWTSHWAIGNLNGLYGYSADTYGAAFGRYANDSSFLTTDATNGVRILKRASSADTVLGQWAMDGTITVGQVAAGQGNVLISSGAIALRVNTTETIKLLSTGAAVFGQVATGKGNAYWNPTNDRLEFRGSTNGTVVQAYVDTDGSIVAGAGGVWLNADGVQVAVSGETYSSARAMRWLEGASEVATIWAKSWGYTTELHLACSEITGAASNVYIDAVSPTNKAARISLRAYSAAVGLLEVIANTDASTLCTINTTNTIIYGDTYVTGGLNLGTATGAGEGQIRASGSLALSGQTSAQLRMNYLSLANGATGNVTGTAAINGMFYVWCVEEEVGAIVIRDAVAATTLVSNPSTRFATSDTASKHCVYYSAPNLVLKNNRGAARTYRIMVWY